MHSIQYFEREIDRVGFTKACRNFGIGKSVGDEILLMRKITPIAERKILAVVANREKLEKKYKGTRKRQDNTQYRERVPNAFLDAMELD